MILKKVANLKLPGRFLMRMDTLRLPPKFGVPTPPQKVAHGGQSFAYSSPPIVSDWSGVG